MKQIKQKHYPALEIDNREKDIVIIWQNGEPIQIERENIPEIISLIISQK